MHAVPNPYRTSVPRGNVTADLVLLYCILGGLTKCSIDRFVLDSSSLSGEMAVWRAHGMMPSIDRYVRQPDLLSRSD